MAAGDLAIYGEDTGQESITTSGITGGAAPWDTTIQEDSIFTLDGTTKSVDCDEDGHYLVIYNIAYEIPSPAPATPTRAQVASTITINGSGTSYGRSGGYYRGVAQVGQEGGLHGASIVDLSAGDDLAVVAARIDTAGTNGNIRRKDNKDNGSRLTIVKLNDDWDYLGIRNTAILAASSTTFADYTWNTNDEVDGAYTHSTSTNTQNVTIEEDGLYMVFFNAEFVGSSTANRTQMEVRMMRDAGGGFSEELGTRTTAYIAAQSGCTINAATYKGIHEFSADDIIKFQYRHNNLLGTVGFPLGLGALAIVKLPDTAEVFRIHENGGGAQADTTADYDFDTTDREDTASFDHQTSPPDEVDAQEDMYALLFCTFYSETTGSRNTNRIQNCFHYYIDGTIAGNSDGDLGHSMNYAYNRGVAATGIETGGASQCGLMDSEVDASETIVFQNEKQGTGADSTVQFGSDFVAAQGLNLGTIFPEYFAIDETVEISEVAGRCIGKLGEDATVEISEEVVRGRLPFILGEDATVEVSEVAGKCVGLLGEDATVEVSDVTGKCVGLLGEDATVEISEVADRGKLPWVLGEDATVNIRDNDVRMLELHRAVDDAVEISDEGLNQPGFEVFSDDSLEISEEVFAFLEQVMFFGGRMDVSQGGPDAMSAGAPDSVDDAAQGGADALSVSMAGAQAHG